VKPSYTLFFRSQAESTLSFALILSVFHGLPVEKRGKLLWIKLWKIRQAFLNGKLVAGAREAEVGYGCGKRETPAAKKNYQEQNNRGFVPHYHSAIDSWCPRGTQKGPSNDGPIDQTVKVA
jgi:hypothetical protein